MGRLGERDGRARAGHARYVSRRRLFASGRQYPGADRRRSAMPSRRPRSEYHVPLPEPGEPKRAILDSYTKEHSAEYQAQALIDLAFKLRPQITNFEDIEEIVIMTSHHTHNVIGTGAGDPSKRDPNAS